MRASTRDRVSPSLIRNAEIDWAYPVGFWSALLNTAGGILYFLVIGWAILSGRLTNPPDPFLQTFGGIISLLVCPTLVVMIACLHAVTPHPKRIFSLVSLAFTLLFASAVTTNRFTQLGVVNQSLAVGTTEGISWFLPYGDHSVMFGLEMMGWGWFLGLAMLSAAPIFSSGKLESWLRRLMLLYSLLGLLSAVGFLLASPISVIGFAAWGLVLYLITALLAIYFRKGKQ